VEDLTADDNAKVIAQAVRKENKFASKALLSKVEKTELLKDFDLNMISITLGFKSRGFES
jgi:hypothetical protein